MLMVLMTSFHSAWKLGTPDAWNPTLLVANQDYLDFIQGGGPPYSQKDLKLCRQTRVPFLHKFGHSSSFIIPKRPIEINCRFCNSFMILLYIMVSTTSNFVPAGWQIATSTLCQFSQVFIQPPTCRNERILLFSCALSASSSSFSLEEGTKKFRH